MELKDKLQQSTRIEFSRIRRNPQLAAALFTFVPPPGVDVIGAPKANFNRNAVPFPMLASGSSSAGSLIALIVVGSLIPHVPTFGLQVNDKLEHFGGYFLLMFWFSGLYERQSDIGCWQSHFSDGRRTGAPAGAFYRHSRDGRSRCARERCRRRD